MKPKCWLWPDHTIGKRESRRLREEHNAVVNLNAELLAALQRCVNRMESKRIDHRADWTEIDAEIYAQCRSAIAKAEQ